MMKRVTLGFLAVVAAVAAVCVFRATRLEPYSASHSPPDSVISAAQVPVEPFAAAVRYPTISSDDATAFNPAPFVALHEHLRTSFPLVHTRLEREVVNDYSLLYTWTGSDTSLDPMLLMGHLDVVPVESGTETSWKHPPFGGLVDEGFIWGRGTLDDKLSVVAILHAAELLLNQGFTPRRTIYFAFGHDEELGGHQGAARLSARLQQKAKRLAFLLDEGGVVGEGIVPGVSRPVALIGVVEKTSLNVELVVEQTGGHSSMPPPHTAVGVLSKAITRLEDNPFGLRLTPVGRETFTRLAPEMPFVQRLVIGNLWLLRPVLLSAMSRNHQAAATLRTTTAVTMISGSPKSNVLPIRARAVVNFRILPGDTPDAIVEHVRRVIADTAVKASIMGSPAPPAPVADYHSPEFGLLERTIGQFFPRAVPTPFLMIGGTDTRHYEPLTRNIFRFNPIVATPEMVSGAHGTNERVRVDDYQRAVRFFAQLMRNAQGFD
jgi:carboxypeptidase PM20D1